MSADSRRRPASLAQAGRSKFENEVFDNVTESTAAEESGFRLIRGGEEGGVKVLKRYCDNVAYKLVQSHSSSSSSRRFFFSITWPTSSFNRQQQQIL